MGMNKYFQLYTVVLHNSYLCKRKAIVKYCHEAVIVMHKPNLIKNLVY